MYPNSAMGTIALMKQTFMDAEWYIRAWGAYEASGRALLPPETERGARRARPAVQGASSRCFFETGSEEEYLRAYKLAQDYKLTPWFRGSGRSTD
jgi:hypothetical protein